MTRVQNRSRRDSHEDRVTIAKTRPTQSGVHEKTASSRRHASRLTVDSLPSMFEDRRRGFQHRQSPRTLAPRASDSDYSIITMPQERGASARSGYFGSRNSRPPSCGARPRFQNHQNRVRSVLVDSNPKSEPVHFTALHASEMLALRWGDVLWNEGRIRIQSDGRKGRMARLKRRCRTDMVRCIWY